MLHLWRWQGHLAINVTEALLGAYGPNFARRWLKHLSIKLLHLGIMSLPLRGEVLVLPPGDNPRCLGLANEDSKTTIDLGQTVYTNSYTPQALRKYPCEVLVICKAIGALTS